MIIVIPPRPHALPTKKYRQRQFNVIDTRTRFTENLLHIYMLHITVANLPHQTNNKPNKQINDKTDTRCQKCI